MSACERECCGGRPAFLAAKEKEMQEKRDAFEAWYVDPANDALIERIKAEVAAEREKVPA